MSKEKKTTKKTTKKKSSTKSTKDILLIGYWQHLRKYLKQINVSEDEAIIVTWENLPTNVFKAAHAFKFPKMQGWKDEGLIEQGLQNGSAAMIEENIRKVKEVHIVHNRTYVIKEDLTTKGVREINARKLILNG